MSKKKTGRLTKAEEGYIREHYPGDTPEAIADALNRFPGTVRAFVAEHNLDGSAPAPPPPPKAVPPAHAQIQAELRASMAWENLKEEFEPRELRYFEEKYVAYKSQFQDDVYASEEGQLFKLIKFEILMHRNLVQQKRARQEMDRLERAMSDMTALFADPSLMDDADQARLANLSTDIHSAKASELQLTAQHEKLDKGHQDILKSLKASREQRLAKATESKRSLLDIIRMLADQDQRERADRMVDQMHRQAGKEITRLGSLHQYADGSVDRPILSADTAEMET